MTTLQTPAEHCSACGRESDYSQTCEGYTGCCNKTTCEGRGQRRYAATTPQDHQSVVTTVTACCSAVADQTAREQGLVASYLMS